MNIQIFGSAKSFDSKKAERWFRERRIKYQFIDMASKGMSPGEYRSVKAKVGADALINTGCRAYDELDMAYLSPAEAERTALEVPAVFNVPVVRNGKDATVGYHPEIWEKWE